MAQLKVETPKKKGNQANNTQQRERGQATQVHTNTIQEGED